MMTEYHGNNKSQQFNQKAMLYNDRPQTARPLTLLVSICLLKVLMINIKTKPVLKSDVKHIS